MAASPQQRGLTRREAERAAESLVSSAQPARSLKIEDKTVLLRDISIDIVEFNKQSQILEHYRLLYPCVIFLASSLDEEDTRERVRVPINISDYDLDTYYWQTRDIVERQINNATHEIQSAGLQVEFVSTDQAKESFIKSISRLLTTRWGHAKRDDDEDNEPPTDDIIVYTKKDQIDVLYANGHFVSTKKGFGRATPAHGKLFHGNYTFGVKYRGCITFSDILWDVPRPRGEDIYLELP